jgi:hypothetical protein
MQSTPKFRPIGVTIIAILNIIGGIIMLFGAIPLITLGIISPTTLPPAGVSPMVSLSLLGGIGIAIGGILVAIAIASFVVAYGLLKGRGWAWTITVVLSIINIVLNVIAIAAGNIASIINIIISGIILYYLYRSHVKAYFGKGVSPSPPAA